MLVAAAVALFAAVSLAAFLAGLISAGRRFAFVRAAYRVQGQVISEWNFRHRGLAQRYYRVEFQLHNGQRAELRGSGKRPLVGQSVTVLVRERANHDPRAQISAWAELWLPSAALLFIGAIGTLMTFTLVRGAWA